MESHYPAGLDGLEERVGVLAPLTQDLGRLFPGGLECFYHGTSGANLGVGLERMQRRHVYPGVWPGGERGREGTSPLAEPYTRRHHPAQRWTRLWGITGAEISIRGDKIYTSLSPGPVSLDHVALVGRVGGTNSGNGLAPSTFPYLQICPPHCLTCFCWITGDVATVRYFGQ